MIKRLGLVFASLCAVWLIGCSDNNDSGGDKKIDVPDQTELDQVVTAGETEGSSKVNFTTTGPWTSAIEDVSTKGETEAWVSISPDHGDAAGDYEIAIKMLPNNTSTARKAVIKIICDGSQITITVEQKGVGEVIDPENARRISKLEMIDPDGDKEKVLFEYDDKGRVIHFESYSYGETLSSETDLTYEANQIVCDLKDHEDNVEGEPYYAQLIYKLENARIVSCVIDGQQDEAETWEYNSDGYKISYTAWEESCMPSPEGDFTCTTIPYVTKYSWTDGLMTREDEYDEDNKISSAFGYQYSDLVNKVTSLNLNAILMDADLPDILNLSGKQSGCLVSQITVLEDVWDKEWGTDKYRYVLDEDGYVTEVYCAESEDGEIFDEEYLTLKVYYE